MILVATHVHAVSGIALEDALWNIPAAVAYQLDLVYWQRQGNVFKRDNRADILKESAKSMADGLVNIIFQADDSSTTKAFAALNAQFEGSAKRTVNWTSVQKLSGQAAEFMSAANYKTAASFKPATDAQRAASVAAEEGAKSMGNLTTQIGLTYVAYRLLREGAEAVKYVATQSADLETATVRFKNLAGNWDAATKAFEGLKVVAKETNTNLLELIPAATTLLESKAVPMAGLDDAMHSIADRARIAGSTVAEMSDIVLRANTRGEVSGKQIAMISKVTGDEVGRLSAEYKEMTITIPLLAVGAERLQKATSRTREDAERLLTAQTGFAEKHGNIPKVMEEFTRFSGQGGAPYVPIPGLNIAGGGQKQMQSIWKQMQEGIKQIGKEEGISPGEMTGLVHSGMFDYGEIMAGSKRFHEAAALKTSRGFEDYNMMLEKRKESDRLDIASRAVAGIIGPEAPAVKGEVANVAETQGDMWKQMGNEIAAAAQGAGDGLRNLSLGIDTVVKSLTGYDATAHPVKGAQLAPSVLGVRPGGPRTDWTNYQAPPPAPVSKDSGLEQLAAVMARLVALLEGGMGGG